MVVKNREGIAWKITFIVVIVLGLSLAGCGNVDLEEAQAQTERGIRTYDIVPNTFEIRSDTDPTIVVLRSTPWLMMEECYSQRMIQREIETLFLKSMILSSNAR